MPEVQQGDLLRRLNRELGTAQPDGARLTVSDVRIAGMEHPDVVLMVDAIVGGRRERWRVRCPIDPEEERELSTQVPTLAVVVGALVAEWWALRHAHAELAVLGERLPLRTD